MTSNKLKDIFDRAPATTIELEPRQANKGSATLIALLLWVAAMFLSKFSYFSSASDYLTILGRTDVASDRVMGLQLAILVFWSIATLFVIQSVQSRGWRRAGCLVGVVFAVALGSIQSLDSAITSMGYQSHMLGKLTQSDRGLEARIEEKQLALKQADDRYIAKTQSLEVERKQTLYELQELDKILAPAIASGTNLKASYSENRSAVSQKLANIDQQIATIRAGRVEYKEGLYGEISASRQELNALNSSGVSRASRFVGISPETNIALKTMCCELALIALAIMTALGGNAFANAPKEGKMIAGTKLSCQLATIGVTFFLAHKQFLSEAPEILENMKQAQSKPATVVKRPVQPAAREMIDPALFGQSSEPDHDGLPQWEGSMILLPTMLAPKLGPLPSKLEPLRDAFIEAGKANGIDPAFLAAICMHETGNGTSKAFRYKNNTHGVMRGKTIRTFSSKTACIHYMAERLATKSYYTKHKHNIEGIASVYAPANANNDPRNLNHHWPTKVRSFLRKLNPASKWL